MNTASTAYCINYIHWFDLFAPKTMFPPPYTIIPLHPLYPLHTAYCVHSIHWFDLFCIKDNVPTTIYHNSTVYCIHCVHCVLCPLCDCVHWIHWVDLFVPKTMFPPPYTTIPLCTASTAYCIHCVHWFDLFAPKTMSPPPYITIPLCPLCTASTEFTGLTFLHQRQCPHNHIPLFHCVHCVLRPLHPLVWPFCTKDNVPTTIYHYSTVYCVHCMPYMAYVGNLFALTKCPPHPPMLLVTHETITNQKLVISNQCLISPPPTKKVPKTYTAWPI